MRRLMKVSSFMPKLFCKRIYARINLYFIEFNSEAHPNGLEMPVVN
jgi:hypothetical protein